MKKFRVLIPELHLITYEVEAENPEDAKTAAAEGGDIMYTEISYVHPSETWKVEEIS